MQRGASPLEPHPDHEAARIAFSSLLILASRQMVELANEMQDVGNQLGLLTSTRDIARRREAEWEPAADRYGELRRQYIDRARREVWAGTLPGRLFGE